MTNPKESQQPPPAVQLMQFITGHWVAAAVHAAAQLKIADHLAAAPRSSTELSEAVSAHRPSVYRLMRALSTLGVFEEVEADRFQLTEVGKYLQSDYPGSMRPMALFQGADPHWRGWGSFLHSIKTGQPAFEHVNGMGFFDYCQTDDEFSAAFNGAMTALSATAAEAVSKAYDFSGIDNLVDVGGGHGYLLATLLKQNSDLRGTVFDLPHVVSGAPDQLSAAGVSDRCQVVGGDFFESVPSGDVYISKNIIHDWDDEHSIKILTNMRKSMVGRGRVLLVEVVITDDNRNSVPILIDLEMLHATHGGRERTAAEFADLFSAAGFQLEQIVETQSLFCIVEGVAKS